MAFSTRRCAHLCVLAMGLWLFGCGDDKESDGDDAGASNDDAGASNDGGGGSNSGNGSTGSDAGSNGGGGSSALCDNPDAQSHTCTEFITPDAAMLASFKMECVDVLKGMIVESCSAGRVGGCKLDQGGGTSSITWYYDEEASADRCGKSATWVTPP